MTNGLMKTVCPCCDTVLGQLVRPSGKEGDLFRYEVCGTCTSQDEDTRVIGMAEQAIDMWENPGEVWSPDTLSAAMSTMVRAHKVLLSFTDYHLLMPLEDFESDDDE